jgi:hypothetical protein
VLAQVRCLQASQRLCERMIDDPTGATENFAVWGGADLNRQELQYTLDILVHAIA